MKNLFATITNNDNRTVQLGDNGIMELRVFTKQDGQSVLSAYLGVRWNNGKPEISFQDMTKKEK